jgi:hypothetical protein
MTFEVAAMSKRRRSKATKQNELEMNANHVELELQNDQHMTDREESIQKLMKRKRFDRATAEEVVNAVNDRQGPHIKVTAKGEAYFEQVDIRFSVDAKDLNNVVGCNRGGNVIDKLMDSQVAMLATANYLPIHPFVRELLRPVLTGLVQLVWYRDLEGRVSEHLRENHARRVELYKAKLSQYKEPAEGSDKPAARSHKATTDWSKTYAVSANKQKAEMCKGREAQLLAVIKGLGKGSFAQIVEASRNKVQTTQKLDRIVGRFLKELIRKGAVIES